MAVRGLLFEALYHPAAGSKLLNINHRYAVHAIHIGRDKVLQGMVVAPMPRWRSTRPGGIVNAMGEEYDGWP